ncbi:uncharacterized protein [Zea mays]|uniref:uncharacterized protein isoform X4 n=1 Tax=Zea mays TaxID=4577 RepID=UPI0016520D34|nr:uncharacterized protein LOC103655242 isoform X4 [Zea mays]XP_035823139.1 uncharacterized protein LOC118471923 isoform X4 [Zea mays]XP_035823143.1 uncharacterized protein LOC118476898 isoform X4 [Zea mays]
MAFEVEEDDAHPRGRSNATVIDEQGDCHRKGKSVIGASSSDVAGMSTMPENTVEVVTQNGRRVKLKGGIESPWSHGEPYGNGFSCNYCTSRIKGGGATRLREHLGGLPGNVAACINVPLNVKAIMTDQVAIRRIRRRRNNDLRHYVEREVRESNKGLGTSSKARIPLDEEGQIQMALKESLREYDEERFYRSPSGSRSASCSANQQTRLDRFYRSPSISQGPFDIDLAHSRAQAQPRVDIMLRGGSRDKLGKALAKWFHANDIPGRKADCPYFRSAIKLAQECGQGVHIPSGKDLDGKFLDMNYEDMEAHMAKFKDDWKEYGVTVMCDSWTDNGSNYKKACRQLITRYPHITWQPCAAHTINLMLKDISRFSEVSQVVDDAKRICRFFYNHNRLHAMMREKIGGELIRWNATRFGTVFIFLQSFWDRQDKFMQWMVSDDWKNNAWKDEADHAFTYDCLLNRRWWSDMELVLNAVTPIYTVLRYADQQKNATIAGFLPKIMTAMAQIRGNLSKEKDLLDRIVGVIKKRLKYMVDDTLIVAAGALDPKTLYMTKLSRKSSTRHAVTLALKKLASSSKIASAAIEQYAFFCEKRGLFAGEEAERSATNGRMSAAEWWSAYGGEHKELQMLARRIVSQCLSSSGCERNWSTFALVHTKLRNRLGYEKLHKLVYVHYNLKLRIQHFENDMQSLQEMQVFKDTELDPYSVMIDCAMYDEGNPIMDWLCNSRSESTPILDEYDDNELESPIPSRVLMDELGMDVEVTALKRKLDFNTREGKKKRKAGLVDIEEEIEDDVESDSSDGSPINVELCDSSSDDDGTGDEFGDEWEFRGPSGGGACEVGPSGGGACDVGPSGDGSRDGAMHEQAAPNPPLRPRSTRLKKVPVKELYK